LGRIRPGHGSTRSSGRAGEAGAGLWAGGVKSSQLSANSSQPGDP
jgi:hypothetical protein